MNTGKIFDDTDRSRKALLNILEDQQITLEALKESEKKLSKRNYELAAINLLSGKVSESLSLDDTISAAIEGLAQTIKAEVSFIFLKEDNKLILKGIHSVNSKDIFSNIPEHKVGECMCGLAVSTKTPIYSKNIFNDERCTWQECKKAGLKSFTALPLFNKDNVIGVIGLSSKEEYDFESESGYLETLSKTISIGIANSILFTQTKETEKNLIESEKSYRELIDGMNETVWIIDFNGNLIDVNKRSIEILGYSKEELLSIGLSGIDSSLKKEDFKKLADAVKTNKLQIFETWHKTKDGRSFPVEIYSSLVTYKGSQVILSIARDITERVQAEKALRDSEEKFKLVFKTSPDSININRLTDGKYVDINEGFTRITGYTADDVIGKTSLEINIWENNDDRTKLVEGIKKYGRVDNLEAKFKIKDGRVIDGLMSASIILLNNEEHIISISRDITERKFAEESIRRNEHVLRLFVEHSPASIAMFDKEMNYIVASRRYLKDYDLPEQNLVGRSHYEVFPEIPERWKEIHKNCLAGALKKCEKDPFPRINGKLDWIRWEIHPWYERSGEIGGIIIFSEVITEREKIQIALHESQQLLQSIIDNSPTMIYICDLNGKFNLANKRLQSLYNLPQEQIIGKERRDLMPETIAEQHRNNDLLIIKNKQTMTFEEENLESDGKHFYITQKFPLIDHDGNIYSVGGISTDITQRKKAEEALKQSFLTTSTLYQASKDLVNTLKIDQVGSKILESVNQLLKWQRGSIWLLNEDKSQLNLLNHSDMGLKEAEFRKELERIKKIVTKPGVGISGWVALHGKPIRSGNVKKDKRYLEADPNIQSELCVPIIVDGQSVGCINVESFEKDGFSEEDERLLTTLANLSSAAIKNAQLFVELNYELKERIKAEEEIYKLNLELEQRVMERTGQLQLANKELEAFAYSVSHDLRAPLRGILGFARILLDENSRDLNNEGKRICSIIIENSSRMGQLIDDLLAFSRLGRSVINKSTIEMKHLINSVFLEVTDSGLRKRIELKIGDIPSAVGDTNLIKQVWINLLSNAIKFSSKKKKIKISISSKKVDNKNIFCIKDNGAGFDMKYVDKIFGVFQRLHSDKEFDGTGVGLAIVQRIIIRHGGQIWAEGKVGKGASFSFSLPEITAEKKH